MAKIHEALGDEFYEKYLQALKENRYQRLKLTEEVKRLVINEVKTKMKPENAFINWPYNNTIYHVLLVETPRNLQTRELQFGMSVSFRWLGKWVSAVVPKEEFDKIAPEQAYLLVGFLKKKQGDNRTFLNMTVYGIITMDEVAKYSEEKQQDQQATQEAVE